MSTALAASVNSLIAMKNLDAKLTSAIATSSDETRRLEGTINWASAGLLTDADLKRQLDQGFIDLERAEKLTSWREAVLKQCRDKGQSVTLFILDIRARNTPAIEQSRRFTKACYAERELNEAAMTHELSLIESDSQRKFLAAAKVEDLETFLADLEAGNDPGRYDTTDAQRLATASATDDTMEAAVANTMSAKS